MRRDVGQGRAVHRPGHRVHGGVLAGDRCGGVQRGQCFGLADRPGQPVPDDHPGTARRGSGGGPVPQRRRGRDRDRPAHAGRQHRPRQRLQRTGRDDDQRPVADLAADRAEHGFVQGRHGRPEQGVRGLPAGGSHGRMAQPAQRERDPVDQFPDHGDGRGRPQHTPSGGDGQHVHRVVVRDELQQGRGAQPVGQARQVHRLDRVGGGVLGLHPAVVADPPLQRDLPLHQAGDTATGQVSGADPGRRGPQLGHRLGHDRVLRRPGRAQQQVAGAASLRPPEHRLGPAFRHRDVQSQLDELDPMPGGVGAQVGGAECGAVLVEDAQPGPDRRAGAAPVVVE